jgi:hypothetical protein
VDLRDLEARVDRRFDDPEVSVAIESFEKGPEIAESVVCQL